MLKPIFENIPLELRVWKQWVPWDIVKRDGKDAKIPFIAEAYLGRKRNRVWAASNKSETWTTFENARRAYEISLESNEPFAGVGFVVTLDDPYIGLDWDHVVIDGKIDEAEFGWMLLLNGYNTLSPSGYGVRGFIKAKLNGRRSKIRNHEQYDTNRFLTITGVLIDGLPPSPEEVANYVIPERQAEFDSYMEWLLAGENKGLRQKGADLNPGNWRGASFENSAEEGHRHENVVSLVGRYVGRGLKDDEIAALIVAWNSKNPKPKESLMSPDSTEIADAIRYCREKENEPLHFNDPPRSVMVDPDKKSQPEPAQEATEPKTEYRNAAQKAEAEFTPPKEGSLDKLLLRPGNPGVVDAEWCAVEGEQPRQGVSFNPEIINLGLDREILNGVWEGKDEKLKLVHFENLPRFILDAVCSLAEEFRITPSFYVRHGIRKVLYWFRNTPEMKELTRTKKEIYRLTNSQEARHFEILNPYQGHSSEWKSGLTVHLFDVDADLLGEVGAKLGLKPNTLRTLLLMILLYFNTRVHEGDREMMGRLLKGFFVWLRALVARGVEVLAEAKARDERTEKRVISLPRFEDIYKPRVLQGGEDLAKVGPLI